MASPESERVEATTTTNVRRAKNYSLTIIFRYADWIDYLLMLLGTFGAIGDGMSTNCLLVFASQIMNSLGDGNGNEGRLGFMVQVEKVTSMETMLCVNGVLRISLIRVSYIF